MRTSAVTADLVLPPDLAAEIEKARAFVEAEWGGTVKINVSWQTFTTWWAKRFRAQPTTDIELMACLTMRIEAASISNGLIQHHREGGAFWLHPDAVRRMVRWLADPSFDDEFRPQHSPFSDEETARLRAEWEAEQAQVAAKRSGD